MIKDKYIQKLEELNAMMLPHAEFYGAESDSFMNLLSQVNKLKAEMEKEGQVASPTITYPNKCDVCGNTPSVIIITNFGSFCEAHVRYFK